MTNLAGVDLPDEEWEALVEETKVTGGVREFSDPKTGKRCSIRVQYIDPIRIEERWASV